MTETLNQACGKVLKELKNSPMTEQKSECCGADIVEDFDAVPFGASKEYKCSKCEVHYTSPSPEKEPCEWEERFDEKFPSEDVSGIKKFTAIDNFVYKPYETSQVKFFIRQLLLSTRQEADQRVARAVEEERERVIKSIEIWRKNLTLSEYSLNKYWKTLADLSPNIK